MPKLYRPSVHQGLPRDRFRNDGRPNSLLLSRNPRTRALATGLLRTRTTYYHVLYHSPAYNRSMAMMAKLRFCGARRVDFWPRAVFDAAFDMHQSADTLLTHPLDIDIQRH